MASSSDFTLNYIPHKVQEINLLCITEAMPFGKHYFKSDFEEVIIFSLLEDENKFKAKETYSELK